MAQLTPEVVSTPSTYDMPYFKSHNDLKRLFLCNSNNNRWVHEEEWVRITTGSVKKKKKVLS
ncbi:hypothetical protein TSUD_336330 [Trifolium subterraneum]|uniref:Uncharacterized protein n=1 Tax=Trifolium subterraneum TaxID=3900 RepID=A0A2Z6LRF9_TRISU|nr:hypothetical protein TSUD_336330 [Trifolium subterraneum]